ncbi:MAG TPA: LCP family protein [Caldilineaceae bacterium]|nr:LCP family protein [Caldilineaceae bacterium]
MSKQYYSLSTPAQPQSNYRSAGTVLVTLIYGICVLGAAFAGGYRLYQWARWSIVDNYTLTTGLSMPAVQNNSQEQGAVAAVDMGTTAEGDNNTESRPTVAFDPVNILLLGTDDRPDEVGPARTDTIILLTLDPRTSTAGMLSFPRDLWVNIPGYNTASKINTAYGMGERSRAGTGSQVVMDTISSFIGYPVDYYVRINFNGFVETVDLIGGIDIMVPKTIHDEEYPTADYGVETFHLDAGLQHLDGATALKYARTRHADDDYARARRQQDVIRAVLDKVLRADMLASLLPKAWQLINTMRSSIDTNIPIPVQIELATYMREAALQEIRQEVLDHRYGEEKITDETGWILIPDRDKVSIAVNRFFSPPVSADPTASFDPDWVRIEILNGTGEWGIAARTRDYLQQNGWHVVAIGDADRSDYSQTIIINYGVPQTIVEQVGTTLSLPMDVASLQGLDSSHPVDLRIVVGRDLLPFLE